MGILDKLRPQSKTTHPDPNIRIEAVHETDAGDLASLSGFAKDDADARVRRAAVARITDAAVLADIARNESEASVRDHAVGAVGGAGLEARRRPSHRRPCLRWPRWAASASWPRWPRRRALKRCAGRPIAAVRDQKSLGSIARHAAEGSARLLAVERLTDAAEIEGVALRGEHADAAVAAVDRLESPSIETLTGISQKARAKAAQKKARTLLKAAEPAAEAPVEAGPAFKEADQQTARDLVTQMTALSAVGDFTQLREAYAAGRVAWVELLADADIQDNIQANFENASEVVRQRLAADEAARADAERQRRALEQEQADRIAVCAAGRKPLRRRHRRSHLPKPAPRGKACRPCRAAWAAELDRRFSEACRAAEKREERRLLAKQSAERLPTLVPEIEALSANPRVCGNSQPVVRAA